MHIKKIFQLYKQFASESETATFRKMFLDGGMGYGTAKTMLFEKMDSVLSKPRAEYERLLNNKQEIDAVLQSGADIARKIASRTIEKVKKKMLG